MLINGKVIAQTIYDSIKARVKRLPFQPVFCDVLVGDDPASKQYVRMKARIAETLGIRFLNADFPITISGADLIKSIQDINLTPNLAGLIVQLPLPSSFNRTSVLDAIDPRFDVDCLNSANLDLFYAGRASFVPPTPAAVLTVLDSVLHNAHDKKFVVVGQGELVGRPVAYILRSRGYDVDIIDSKTADPQSISKNADVIITAAGKPNLVTSSWIKEGAIVIDAGTAENEGSVVGDVDTESIKLIASHLSPTPGGVGPVTIAKLLENVVTVAERQGASTR